MPTPNAVRDKLNLVHRPGSSEGRAKAYLDELLQMSVIAAEDWQALPAATRTELSRHSHRERLLERLVDHRLLTSYQAGRLRSGQKHGLLIGPYRVRERLGAGSAGVVFRAEHVQSRQAVALKVMLPAGNNDGPLLRFHAERQVAAQLQHPHIVRVLDIGEAPNPDPDCPVLHYLANELVEGMDLEEYVQRQGLFAPEQAYELARQIGEALAHAHAHGLVHRDLKPANILWTEQGQAKLLDFGLVRHAGPRHTQPGAVLGTLEYIAPEQAQNPSVDIRADLFALGATVFFCVTGQPPFPARGDLAQIIARRLRQEPPSVLALNPAIPAALDGLLLRLMALCPDDRFATPTEFLSALQRCRNGAETPAEFTEAVPATVALESAAAPPDQGPRVLVISHQEAERRQLGKSLNEGWWWEGAADADAASACLARHRHDVVLIDQPWPGCLETVRRLRRHDAEAAVKLLVLAPAEESVDVAVLLAAGADDYLPAPWQAAALQLRVKSLLQLQEAQRRAARLAQPAPTPNPTEPVAAPPSKKSWFRRLLGSS